MCRRSPKKKKKQGGRWGLAKREEKENNASPFHY
jgi:hypothetical protein